MPLQELISRAEWWRVLDVLWEQRGERWQSRMGMVYNLRATGVIGIVLWDWGKEWAYAREEKTKKSRNAGEATAEVEA